MAEIRTDGKQAVIARTADGRLFTVGPVYSGEAAAKLAGEVRSAGVEVLSTGPALSASEFRADHR